MTGVGPGYQHPLPWSLPGDDWLHLSGDVGALRRDARPYAIQIGQLNGVVVSLTDAELDLLAQRIAAVRAAPFLVRILGGLTAQRWMVDALAGELAQLRARYPSLVLAHAGRPETVDGLAQAWADHHGVTAYVDPAGVRNGGNLALVVMAGGMPEHWRPIGLAEEAGIPSRRLEAPNGADRTPISGDNTPTIEAGTG